MVRATFFITCWYYPYTKNESYNHMWTNLLRVSSHVSIKKIAYATLVHENGSTLLILSSKFLVLCGLEPSAHPKLEVLVPWIPSFAAGSLRLHFLVAAMAVQPTKFPQNGSCS